MKIGNLLRIKFAVALMLTIYSGASAAIVQVTVDWNKVVGSSSDFSYGVNGFKAFDPKYVSDTAYINTMKYMKCGMVRLHSWEMMNNVVTTSNIPGWLTNDAWNEDRIKMTLDAYQKIGSEVMINIPSWPSSWNISGTETIDTLKINAFVVWCAELVRIVNIKNHYGVKYFEITNERDNFYMDSPQHYAVLIDIYRRAALAMKKIDPSIQTGGLAWQGREGIRYSAFLRATAHDENPTTLEFTSTHYYGGGSCGSNPVPPFSWIGNTAENGPGVAQGLLTVATQATDRPIPTFLGENNISWDPGSCSLMSNYVGALYDAVAMVAGVEKGLAGVQRWNEMDGGYGVMDYDFMRRPVTHVYHMLNHFFVGESVAAHSDNTAGVKVMAIKTDPRTKLRSVMMINRGDTTQLAKLNLSGWSPDSLKCALRQLSSIGYTETLMNYDGIVLNGINLPAMSVTALSIPVGTPDPSWQKPSAPVWIKKTKPPEIAGSIRVNCGGPEVKDHWGRTWLADQLFSAGSWGYIESKGFKVGPVETGISNTEDDEIYQTSRLDKGTLQYQFAVPNGEYTVTLKFVETYEYSSVGTRVFDLAVGDSGSLVTMNGSLTPDTTVSKVERNFDIAAIAPGNFRAVDRSFDVSIKHGMIQIGLLNKQGELVVSAIEIIPRISGSSIKKNRSAIRKQNIISKKTNRYLLNGQKI